MSENMDSDVPEGVESKIKNNGDIDPIDSGVNGDDLANKNSLPKEPIKAPDIDPDEKEKDSENGVQEIQKTPEHSSVSENAKNDDEENKLVIDESREPSKYDSSHTINCEYKGCDRMFKLFSNMRRHFSCSHKSEKPTKLKGVSRNSKMIKIIPSSTVSSPEKDVGRKLRERKERTFTPGTDKSDSEFLYKCDQEECGRVFNSLRALKKHGWYHINAGKSTKQTEPEIPPVQSPPPLKITLRKSSKSGQLESKTISPSVDKPITSTPIKLTRKSAKRSLDTSEIEKTKQEDRLKHEEILKQSALSPITNKEPDIEYKCTYLDCNKILPRKGNMARHMKIHEDPLPVPCTVKECKWRFKVDRHLRVHLQERHKHDSMVKDLPAEGTPSESPKVKKRKENITPKVVNATPGKHVCYFEECSQSFNKKDELNSHLSSHTSTVVFKCSWEDCPVILRTKKELSDHLLNHGVIDCEMKRLLLSDENMDESCLEGFDESLEETEKSGNEFEGSEIETVEIGIALETTSKFQAFISRVKNKISKGEPITMNGNGVNAFSSPNRNYIIGRRSTDSYSDPDYSSNEEDEFEDALMNEEECDGSEYSMNKTVSSSDSMPKLVKEKPIENPSNVPTEVISKVVIEVANDENGTNDSLNNVNELEDQTDDLEMETEEDSISKPPILQQQYSPLTSDESLLDFTNNRTIELDKEIANGEDSESFKEMTFSEDKKLEDQQGSKDDNRVSNEPRIPKIIIQRIDLEKYENKEIVDISEENSVNEDGFENETEVNEITDADKITKKPINEDAIQSEDLDENANINSKNMPEKEANKEIEKPVEPGGNISEGDTSPNKSNSATNLFENRELQLKEAIEAIEAISGPIITPIPDQLPISTQEASVGFNDGSFRQFKNPAMLSYAQEQEINEAVENIVDEVQDLEDESMQAAIESIGVVPEVNVSMAEMINVRSVDSVPKGSRLSMPLLNIGDEEKTESNQSSNDLDMIVEELSKPKDGFLSAPGSH